MNSGIAPSEGQSETTQAHVIQMSGWRGVIARRSAIVLIAVVAIAVVIASVWFATRARTPGARADQGFARGYESNLPSVRLNGKTEAVRARSILAPLLAGQQVGTLTILKLVPSGSRVKAGEVLVEFDRQAQLRDFVDKQAQSADQNEKVIEAQQAEAAARSKDETEIEQAQSALSKAELEMQKVEVLSRIDAEKAQEDLDEARATLTQLKETFDLKRKAAQASIRILEIQRDRTRETMDHAQTNASLMQIRAPIDGIVVFNTIWKQGNMGEVQEGDQVRPGVPFMEVVDPSVMQVHVLVNQEDLNALKVGEKARVHLDAYPDLAFNGRLESVDPMGKKGDFSAKLRIFSATFSIQGNDPRLMPDLSAAVDVEADLGKTAEVASR